MARLGDPTSDGFWLEHTQEQKCAQIACFCRREVLACSCVAHVLRVSCAQVPCMSTTPTTSTQVRAARLAAHLSQRELAELLGVSARTVQGWEYGVTPQPRHRRLIEGFLLEQAA